MPPKGKAKAAATTQSHPSIQSFFSKEVDTSSSPAASSSPTKPGSGFTEAELESAADPLTRQWNPEKEYDEVTIAELIPGPRAVTFGGRIVNLSTKFGSSPKQPKATGWHFLIVKDDLAAISVRTLLSVSRMVNSN